jgi:hypothetical protein
MLFLIILKSLLGEDANGTTKQRPGFKSAMLADVRPSADGRVLYHVFYLLAVLPELFQKTKVVIAVLLSSSICYSVQTNKVTFSLTPEIIHQVFAIV